MATVIIAAGQGGKAGQGSVPPIMYAAQRAKQELTSSGSNQVSTVTGYTGEAITVSSSGGAIKVLTAVGADPNAATGPCEVIVGDGGVWSYHCAESDTRVAVVDV